MRNATRKQADALKPLAFKQLLFETLITRNISTHQYGADYSAVLTHWGSSNS